MIEMYVACVTPHLHSYNLVAYLVRRPGRTFSNMKGKEKVVGYAFSLVDHFGRFLPMTLINFLLLFRRE